MRKKCYIYTRVSTAMQVDGYSLEAQKERLMKFAEFRKWKWSGNTVMLVNPKEYYGQAGVSEDVAGCV